MKTSVVVGLALSILMIAESSLAEKARRAPHAQKAVKAVAANSSMPSEFSTNMSFEGKSIKGKVQSGSLRKIVVENDKSLDDLLGVRRHFDDREQQEGERNSAW